MSTITSEQQAPALQRGLAILEFLTDHPAGCTAAELSQALEVSGASLFRLTNVLVELGYLHRHEKSRRFTLTRKFLLLGTPQLAQRTLSECAIEALRQVRFLTEETTQLCCLVDRETVVIEQLASLHPFKYFVDLGARCPAYSCAPGKAILAYLPEDECSRIVGGFTFEKFTENTIPNRKTLMTELKQVRERGYAIDRGENFVGINCVGVPVLDRHGYPVGGITIVGPSSRVGETKFEPFVGYLKAAADRIAAEFDQ
jgi:IclR family transcriptional regulator, acetate operon repressor